MNVSTSYVCNPDSLCRSADTIAVHLSCLLIYQTISRTDACFRQLEQQQKSKQTRRAERLRWTRTSAAKLAVSPNEWTASSPQRRLAAERANVLLTDSSIHHSVHEVQRRHYDLIRPLLAPPASVKAFKFEMQSDLVPEARVQRFLR